MYIHIYIYTLYCVWFGKNEKQQRKNYASHFQMQNCILCQRHREIRSLTQMQLYFAGERVCRPYTTISCNISKSLRNIMDSFRGVQRVGEFQDVLE